MKAETEPIRSGQETSEIFEKHYEYVVIDPYAVNLIDKGPRKGKSRLSFYSAFALNATRELMEARVADNVILFGDSSFGYQTLNTAELMFLKLTQPGKGKTSVNRHNIFPFNDEDLNSTPAQVRELGDFVKDNKIDPSQILYLTWDYHAQRVRNHLEGYGLKEVQVASVVDTHKHFRPQFNQEKLDEVLPYEEIEKMESFRRRLSGIDKKGRIPLLLKPVLGGAYTLDNERGLDGQLHFMYKAGKKRLQEI